MGTPMVLPSMGPILACVTTHRLDIEQARRVAVHAQALSADRPTDLVNLVDQITLLQIDPTAAVAPNADLEAWSRLGSTYRPEHLKQAIEEDRTLYELNALVRPMPDLGLYLAEMEAWPRSNDIREWLRVDDRSRVDVLGVLDSSGPLLSREIPDTSAEPWQSSG